MPRQSVRRGRLVGRHALPPHVAVGRQSGVGEDAVLLERHHRVRVRVHPRAGSDAEEARLGVDRVEPAVVAELHPADVVADGLDLPARDRGHEHRQVRLAACGRKRGGEVLRHALRRRQLEDQHVLGEPAVVTSHHRRDAEGEALLAEQRVAAVAGAVRPDLAGVGEVDDVLVLGVARPRHVGLTGLEGRAHRVQARHELAVSAEHVERGLAHARHRAHAHRDVRRVGELHADVRDVRAERAHRERHDVHRPTAHRAGEELEHVGPHRRGIAPVVVRTGLVLGCRADERAVLDTSDVTRIGVRPVAVRPLVELREGARRDERCAQAVVLCYRSVAPLDRCRLEDRRPMVDPVAQVLVCGGGAHVCSGRVGGGVGS